MSAATDITDAQIEKFSKVYKERRKMQMYKFFGATAFTLISARLAFRGVKARKCMCLLSSKLDFPNGG